MKRHLSISLRLTLWVSLAFTVGFLIFGTAMLIQLHYPLSAGRDKTLINRAGRTAALLEQCSRSGDEACITKFADFTSVSPEGNLIRVYNSAGSLLYSDEIKDMDAFPWPALPSEGSAFTKVRYNKGLYRILSESATIGGRQFWIQIGGQLKDNGVILQQFETGLLCTTPPLLLFSAIFGFFMGRRALAPVTKLAASARTISIGNLSRRLPIVETGDEIQAFAETCNELLARLESTAAEISRFTADASHELRSPISYIYTLSESALRNPNLDDESLDSFQEIVRECSDATRLLDDMLTLARFDAEHADTTFTRLDLSKALADTCDKALPFAETKHQQMTACIIKNEPVWIMGDAVGLRRLFWILLDNAIKYTPARGAIDIALETIGKDVVVTVKDTGIGNPKTDLPDIFRRFYRVDKDRSVTDGTGLGLSIAKWISDTHRGGLSIHSVEDMGTTFQILFRLAT